MKRASKVTQMHPGGSSHQSGARRSLDRRVVLMALASGVLVLAAVSVWLLNLRSVLLDANSAAGGGPPPASSSETWTVEALKDSLPAMLAVRTFEDLSASSEVRVASLDSTATTPLWTAPFGIGLRLAGCDPVAGRIVVSQHPAAQSSRKGTTVVFLEPDGTIVRSEVPTRAGTWNSASLASDGRAIVVTRDLDAAGRERSRLWLFSKEGTLTPVAVSGALPRDTAIARLESLTDGRTHAVLLKTPGGPGPDDDFAVVLAQLEGETLRVTSAPYFDDRVVTMSAAPWPDGVVFIRSWATQAGVIHVDLVGVTFKGGKPIKEIIAKDLDGDPGGGPGKVVGSGPSGGLLYRSYDRRLALGGGLLKAIDPDGRQKETKIRIPDLGDQWCWLESFGSNQ